MIGARYGQNQFLFALTSSEEGGSSYLFQGLSAAGERPMWSPVLETLVTINFCHMEKWTASEVELDVIYMGEIYVFHFLMPHVYTHQIPPQEFPIDNYCTIHSIVPS